MKQNRRFWQLRLTSEQLTDECRQEKRIQTIQPSVSNEYLIAGMFDVLIANDLLRFHDLVDQNW